MTVNSPAMLNDRCLNAYKAREEWLRQAIRAAQVNALLVTHHTDIEYLTGFVGEDSWFLLLPEGSSIISDARYDEFLNPWRANNVCNVKMGTRHRLHETVQTLCAAAGVTKLGFQAEHVSVSQFQTLKKTFAPLELVETTNLVGTLRMCKDAVEIETIEQAIAIHQAALDATLGQIAIGMTELQVSGTFDYEMKSRGGFKPSFDSIIGSGPNSSIIHHLSSTAPIREGVLLFDGGVRVDGYCSDLTRTFAVGKFEPKIAEIYKIVLEAQLAAIEACAPGKVCAEIDAVARDVITKAGYGEYFGHGLGHGLGKDVHESPYFNDLQTDVVLQPGMVMTVEPGIYLPGIGGVRIEDDVLITETGYRVLSDFPKDLESAVIEPASVRSGR